MLAQAILAQEAVPGSRFCRDRDESLAYPAVFVLLAGMQMVYNYNDMTRVMVLLRYENARRWHACIHASACK